MLEFLVSRQKCYNLSWNAALQPSLHVLWPFRLRCADMPLRSRPATNVGDGRHDGRYGMRWATKPTQLGTVIIYSNSCTDPFWRKIYLLATCHVTSAHSYLQPFPKTSWSRLMRDQSELADAPSSVKKRCCVLHFADTHLQVDPNNTLCWRNMCHCIVPFQLCGDVSSACYPAVYGFQAAGSWNPCEREWILPKLDETDFRLNAWELW